MNQKKTWKILLGVMACLFLLSVSVSAATKPVAKIGTKSYTTLAAAVKNVKNGQTIKLQRNVVLASSWTLNRNVRYTIDLNKKTLNIRGSRSMNIRQGRITLKNGTLSTLAYVTVGKDAVLNVNSGTYKTMFMNNGKMNVLGGTLKYIENKGILTVKGGKVARGIQCNRNSELYVKGGVVTQLSNSYASGAITVKKGYKVLSVTGGKVRGTTKDWPAIMIIDKKSSKPKINQKCVYSKNGMKVRFAYETDDEDSLGYVFYE